MSDQTNERDINVRGGVQISVLSLETAGLVQLHLEGGPIALAVLLSAGEAIELGQRVHDAANVIEMAGGS